MGDKQHCSVIMARNGHNITENQPFLKTGVLVTIILALTESGCVAAVRVYEFVLYVTNGWSHTCCRRLRNAVLDFGNVLYYRPLLHDVLIGTQIINLCYPPVRTGTRR